MQSMLTISAKKQKSTFRKILLTLSGLILLLFTFSIFATPKLVQVENPPKIEPQPTLTPTPGLLGDLVKVIRVIDGDTIEIEGGKRVRLIGINAPEMGSCFGDEAKNKAKELLENQEIQLEKDVSETDKYDRLLRYIWKDGKLINEILVEEGFASSSTFPPDVKYQDRFLAAQKLAREERRGLWGVACSFSPTPKPTPKT
jgi:micrococcal nuclease